MHTCLECGNRDMRVRVEMGTPIHECALCGARFGDRRAVEAVEDADEARERGVPPLTWPLFRALARLPGLAVRAADPGDVAARTLPFVEIGVADAAMAMVQAENLAKSLQLGAGELQHHWVLEVEYRRHLALVLKPRHPGGPVHAEQVRTAQLDLGTLRCAIERDSRLGWWRDAAGGRSG